MLKRVGVLLGRLIQKLGFFFGQKNINHCQTTTHLTPLTPSAHHKNCEWGPGMRMRETRHSIGNKQAWVPKKLNKIVKLSEMFVGCGCP